MKSKILGALAAGVAKLLFGVWLVMIGLDWANDYWPLPDIGYWGVFCILLGITSLVGLVCTTATTAKVTTLSDSY